MAQLPFLFNTPLLLAASPLVTPWFDTNGGASQIVPWFVFAGGTSTHSLEGSFDGINADADFAYAAPTSGTAFAVVSPWVRWRTVQTVADATKSKLVLRFKV
jgi:hypothetical protein